MKVLSLRKVKIGTNIPLLILEALEDMKYPRLSASVGITASVDQFAQKMLYVLYNVSKRFLNFETKHLSSLYVLVILYIRAGDMGWSDFQCALNFLIAPEK